MTEKSYAALSALICPICGKVEEDGTVLLHKKMKPVFSTVVTTGWGLCKEHKAQVNDGYIGLVEIKAGSPIPYDPGTVLRTGKAGMIKRAVWANVFNVPEPDLKHTFVFVEEGTLAKLEGMVKPDDGSPLDSGDAGAATSGPAG